MQTEQGLPGNLVAQLQSNPPLLHAVMAMASAVNAPLLAPQPGTAYPQVPCPPFSPAQPVLALLLLWTKTATLRVQASVQQPQRPCIWR